MLMIDVLKMSLILIYFYSFYQLDFLHWQMLTGMLFSYR